MKRGLPFVFACVKAEEEIKRQKEREKEREKRKKKKKRKRRGEKGMREGKRWK